MNCQNPKRCTHSLPNYLIHKFLTSSLISWPFNFFTDICIIQSRTTIKSPLKTETSTSKIVKRPGYQASISCFQFSFGVSKLKDPGDETCLEASVKVALRGFQGVFRGQYLPSLGINDAATNKDLEKILPRCIR